MLANTLSNVNEWDLIVKCNQKNLTDPTLLTSRSKQRDQIIWSFSYLRLHVCLLFRRPSVVPVTIAIPLAVSIPVTLPLPFQVTFPVAISVAVSTAVMRRRFDWSLYHYLVLLGLTRNLAHRSKHNTSERWDLWTTSASPNKSSPIITCIRSEDWKRAGIQPREPAQGLHLCMIEII